MGGAAECDQHTVPYNPDWMSALPERIQSIPLNCLAIPGSHDSFAYYLDKNGQLGPDTPTAIKDLTKIFGDFAKEIIYKWSITESLTFTEQLKAGVRYFDLRISSKPDCEDIYLLHMLYGEKLDCAMHEINTFLEEHPKEIVFLDFNHLYDMSEFSHKQCLSMLLEVFGSKMCPYLDMESMTLSELWQNKLQVVIFYHAKIIEHYLQFWPGERIPSPWPDTCNVDELLSFLEENYTKGRPADCFHVTQGVLTPSVAFITEHLFGSLKDDACKNVAHPVVNWVKGKKAGLKGINICMMDFVEWVNFIDTVINLNKNLEL